MKIHIICPFYRINLIPTIIKYFESMGIEYYPMTAPERDVFPKINWIHPIHVRELVPYPTEVCFRKINDFLDTQPIIDGDYYGFITDDDMYEPGFFNVIRKQTEKIIICSLYRGDTIPSDGSPPTGRHPTYPLIINSLSDIRVCNIGLPQYLIKGEVFRKHRFSVQHPFGDGYYAEALRSNYPNNIKIIPNLFVFGAYFQPGRYTNVKKFIKPHWELPKYVEI